MTGFEQDAEGNSSLEGLGEVAMLVEGNDVVVKCLKVAVADDGDSEGGVLAAVSGDAAGSGIADSAEEGDGLFDLHGVSPFCPVDRDTSQRAQRCTALSRGITALPREEVFGKGPGACEGGGVRNPKGAEREF